MQIVPPPVSNVDQSKHIMDQSHRSWAELLYDLLASTELNIDPQAFLDDYMLTGKTSVSQFNSAPD